ncbi:Heat shock protein HslJ [Algoriella xinjiangensis]|uniref:Heat shock protein HslJ n=1 Tax=Algoriella xinjiangensis TaxID=684065 RepID=A0A1I4WNL2_9FLAO|nr:MULTISPECIES: META domain-containing protein [Algoriella]MBO6212677.1 META domain-containing protein [Algoriella sp.]SFN14589.1 Heat shock protein HslJ [Algoriella xinjiangensis]VDH16805.1 heat-inducible protein [Algoriella xinjiangensis]
MKSSILKISFAAILATGFLSSCSTVTNPISNNQTSKDSVLGRWELDYIMTEGGKSLSDAYPMGVPYLDFVSNKMLNASDGCNTMGGGITIEGNQITFGNMMSTMKACEGVQDTNFKSKLQGKLSYAVDGDTMTLIQGDIAIMRFKRAGTLAGTWELEEFIGRDRSAKSLDDRFPNQKPTLTFQNNLVSGNDGCNNLTGGFVAVGNSLTVKNIATTRMACQGVDSDAFGERFNNVNKYEIQNGKLVLYANDVKTMVFKKK